MAIIAFVASADAQTLSLDSCRAMALRNNKQLNATKLKREAFAYTRKAARTKYLPKVDALGGYEYFNKEVSILNNDQKSALSHLGTNAMTRMSAGITDIITGMATKGLITPEIARELGARMNNIGGSLANQGDQLGQQINDAFRTEFAYAQKTIGDDVAAPRPFADFCNRFIVYIDVKNTFILCRRTFYGKQKIIKSIVKFAKKSRRGCASCKNG